jgi:hypothetical protein
MLPKIHCCTSEIPVSFHPLGHHAPDSIRRPPGASSAWHKRSGRQAQVRPLPRSVTADQRAPLDLLYEPRLLAQRCGLERRTARGGRDSIDHAPGGHNDVAAVAGVAAAAAGGRYRYNSTVASVSGPTDPAPMEVIPFLPL